MIRLDGTIVADVRRQNLRSATADFASQRGRKPGLTVIIVGSHAASQVYVKNKVKTASEIGFESRLIELAADVDEVELIAVIESLNRDASVDGILVQLPLPKHINADRVLEVVAPEKDPDGLTTENLGLLFVGRKRVAPCTPAGVMAMLDYYGISLAGRDACVVGRSQIVGKPMAQLLLEANATVTICHSRTPNLAEHTRRHEIVVVAAGQPRFLGREAFAKDSVVIDVGIHRPETGDWAGRLCGDVRFEELDGWVRAASPVPKGVGPMTIQMLMENTLSLARGR